VSLFGKGNENNPAQHASHDSSRLSRQGTGTGVPGGVLKL